MPKINSEDGSTDDGVSADSGNRNSEPEAAIDSTYLMAGRREVTILHGGERYRLRVTANDKLILTK